MQYFNQPARQQCKWGNYTLDVFLPSVNWSDSTSGIYVMAGKSLDGRWRALYIGQASPFGQRLRGHERWPEAVRLGATHVHAMAVGSQADRDRIERELIRLYSPVLNQQLKR